MAFEADSLRPVITMALTVFQSLSSLSKAFLANLGGSKSCSGMSGSLLSDVEAAEVVEVLRLVEADFRDLDDGRCCCSFCCRPTVCTRNSRIFSPRELADLTRSGASEINLTKTSYLVP